MIRRMSAAALGVAAALAVGGVALAAGADDPSPSPSSDDRVAVPMLPNGDPSPTAEPDDDATLAPSSSASSARPISIDAAKAVAIRATGGGRVTEVESETEHGRAVWDIDVLAGGIRHDIHVDKASGAVLRNRVDARVTATGRTPATREAGDDHGGARGIGDDHGGDHSGGDRRGRGSDD